MDGDEPDGWDEGDAVQLSISPSALRKGDSHLPARLQDNRNHYR